MSENTKTIVPFPDVKGIEEQAAEWVAKIDTQPLLPPEQEQLRAWIKQSPRHKEAIEYMSSLWEGTRVLDALKTIDSLPVNKKRSALTSLQLGLSSNITTWKAAGIAAALCLAVFTAYLQIHPLLETREQQTFYTEVGAQKTIKLTDGSAVILNTGTEVTIAFDSKERTVKLLRGEAHFTVAHNPKRPFVVYAAGGAVKAVGTAFSVHVREKSVEVTVSEGVVELLSMAPPLPLGTETSKAAAPPLTTLAALAVGQNAVFSDNIDSLEAMKPADLERKLLWREGFIAFSGEPLSKVISEVSRYTDISIRIPDAALRETPIGGYFKVTDVDDIFKALENAFGLQVNRLDAKNITLTRAS